MSTSTHNAANLFTVRCPICRADNCAADRFCGQCGEPLMVPCQVCGARNAASALYCVNCGGRLTRAEPGAQPEYREVDALTVDQSPADERKHVTILFADLVSSLKLLAGSDPEDARSLLLSVVDRVIPAVSDFGGTVVQVMGDGVMAIFGAPSAYEDHALRACLAAMRIHKEIGEYREKLSATCPIDLQMRVGINSGDVVVGQRGEGFHLQYTAFGETAHVASRLEHMAAPGRILISGSTYALAKGNLLVESNGASEIRGLDRPIETFELRGVISHRRREYAEGRGSPFIGRESEILALKTALQRVVDGKGRIAALVGEPGIGKSRLVREFLSAQVGTDFLMVHCATSPYLQSTPYFAIREGLRSYFAIESADDVGTLRGKIDSTLGQLSGSLEAIAPALRWFFGITEPEWEVAPERRRRRMIQALVDFVLLEGGRRPVLLIVEDLQWADSETESFLANLITAIRAAPVYLLVNYRPEYQHPWVNLDFYMQLSIERLDSVSSMRLLDEMIGVDPTLRTLKELLRERTGGNPLFIEESVRTVEQAGVLVGERGAYRLGRSQDPVVPETVQDILAMRIDRLEPAEKRLLQAAAVIGYDVDAELLRQLVRVAEEDFELQLGRLNMAGLLCEVSHLPRRMYVFGHALTHDVAYSTLLNDLRRRFHWEIVELIEGMNPDSLGLHADVLSHHAIHGARWDKAVEYSRMAGLKALSQSASQLAVAAFERALEAIAELPSNRANHELAHDLRLDMRNALLSLGRNREILAHLGAAEQLALELADDRRLARTRSHLCHCHWILGEWSRSIETGRQALHAAEQLADYGVEVWTRFFMGLAFYSLGGYPDAIRLLTLNAKELTGDAARNRFGLVSHPAVASRGWLAWCLAETGEFDDALSHAEQALSIADEVGNPYDKVQALLGVGGARLLQGEFDKSIAPLESAAVLCDAAEIPILRPRVTATLGYAYALAGRGDDALGAAERASAEVATMHLGAMKAMCLRSVAEVLLLNGQYVAALESAERVLDYCLTSGERGLEAWTGHLVANALLERGAFDEAMAAIEHARDIAKDPGMRPLVCRL